MGEMILTPTLDEVLLSTRLALGKASIIFSSRIDSFGLEGAFAGFMSE